MQLVSRSIIIGTVNFAKACGPFNIYSIIVGFTFV